jgi:hypothetical protein
VSNIDDRALQRNIIALKKTVPAIIVLGSSRMLKVNGDYFNSSDFMNNSVAGASLEDMVAIYQLYKVKGVLPKKIVIGLDPWIFNENNGQHRWKTLSAEYVTFLSDHQMATQQPLINYDNKYLQLLSPSYFQSSLRMLKTRLFAKEKSIPMPTDNKINDGFTRLQDGSINYDKKYRNATLAEVDAKANDYIADPDNVYSLRAYTTLSSTHVELFDTFIKDMADHNIEIQFVLLPYHPDVYNFIAANKQYNAVIACEHYIKDYAFNANIPLIGSFDPTKLNLDHTYFYDGMHLNEQGIKVVLKK